MLLASDASHTTAADSKPISVRHSSTSASEELASEPVPPPPPAPTPSGSQSLSTDPATPQTTSAPSPSPRATDSLTPAYVALRAARDGGNSADTITAVKNFLTSAHNPSVAEFNMALEALHETRRPGEPLTTLLETYNALLGHSLLPNVRTYFILILALTDRDHEVHRMIHSLSVRSDKRLMSRDTSQVTQQVALDQSRIDQLKRENNFGSAMSLFEAAISIAGNQKLPGIVYNNLLRACSYHAAIDSAIHVFAQLEGRKDIRPSALTYLYMMSTYTTAGNAKGARSVFDEFLAATHQHRVSWTIAPSRPSTSNERTHAARNVQIQIWNKMIEAYFRSNPPAPVDALNLLETMINSPAPPIFASTDVPPPASSTYTTIINGFVTAGDLDSAVRWFDHLLAHEDPPRNPFESTKRPVRPDVVAWMTILDAVALASNKDTGRLDDLNRLFKVFCETANRDGLDVRPLDRLIVFKANMHHMSDLRERLPTMSASERDAVKGRLDFLVSMVVSQRLSRSQIQSMTKDIIAAYLALGDLSSTINLLHSRVVDELSHIDQQRSEGTMPMALADSLLELLRKSTTNQLDEVFEQLRTSGYSLPFGAAIEFAKIGERAGVLPSGTQAAGLLHSYSIARDEGQSMDGLSIQEWEALVYAATELELPGQNGQRPPAPQIQGYAFGGVVSLLEDMAAYNVDLQQLSQVIAARLIQSIFVNHGVEELRSIFKRLGPVYEQYLASPNRSLDALAEAVASPVSEESTLVESEPSSPKVHLKINPYTTSYVDELLLVTKENRKPDALAAYQRFESELEKGIVPNPAVLGRLVQGLGRLGEMEKVRNVYTTAQQILATLEHNKKWQSQAWFLIEDSMIIALAHAGDVDSAHVHRLRIIEQGGSPSADAYGALILYVKDTTDDTSNAMMLFQEAQANNVMPNLYFYNNMISKLAKARKADYALELFQEMKAAHIRPSSITYGALIGACARVGDVHSAEILFDEMKKQPNFKPRIPPYNTMMQLYTTTKPNRDRALFYYDALIRAGIRPTAHTYKLLLDVYGTIEPVDISAMEEVFKHLESDPAVTIQGAHWASLINAWGCIVKDLDKAIEVFDSIATHPNTARSPSPLPDAVVFEAMINVLVAHRRTDLIPHFMEKLNAAGIHMTAYIANCLIKGYAITGQLDHARSIFESLQDPPEGVAAPHNHAPHQPGQSSPVELMAPVYREPSTWEVMVRAELGAGNREHAATLLERLQARHYPEAVYNRISGIMVDHNSSSPWSSSSPTPSS
ncbi:hypothetical protein ONZ45_g6863 [Pleurotus djamor]|nr:hypothetical protein ONZ45_g6863 [Pleurotus djamor]